MFSSQETEFQLHSSVQRPLEQTWENLIFIPRTMRHHPSPPAMSYHGSYLHPDSRSRLRGQDWMHRKQRSLNQTQAMQACGKKAAAIHHARGNPSPRPLDLRQPLWDLLQPPAPWGTSWWQSLQQIHSTTLTSWTLYVRRSEVLGKNCHHTQSIEVILVLIGLFFWCWNFSIKCWTFTHTKMFCVVFYQMAKCWCFVFLRTPCLNRVCSNDPLVLVHTDSSIENHPFMAESGRICQWL